MKELADFLIDFVQRAQGWQEVEGAMLQPSSGQLLELERLRAAPARVRAAPGFDREASFIAYLNGHSDIDSHLFADAEACTALAVLDYHRGRPLGPELADVVLPQNPARWGQHRAGFAPPKDPDWLDWAGGDDQLLGQMDFAQFVEDHAANIAAPDPVELVELAQDLQMTSSVSFKSHERMKGGSTRMEFSEVPTQKGLHRPDGPEIPDQLELRLPVFRGDRPVELVAKIRWRLKGGELRLGWHLLRPQDAVEAAFGRMIEGVAVQTGLTPLWGRPPAPGEAGGAGRRAPDVS